MKQNNLIDNLIRVEELLKTKEWYTRTRIKETLHIDYYSVMIILSYLLKKNIIERKTNKYRLK